MAVTCITLSTSFYVAASSAHSQEFIGEQASDWCKQVLKEEFPAKLTIGNIDSNPFKLNAASCRHIGAKKHYQLVLEGGGPKIYFHLLETDIEGKSFVLPCQKKLPDGIYYSEADMYPESGNQIALDSREYCARLSF